MSQEESMDRRHMLILSGASLTVGAAGCLDTLNEDTVNSDIVPSEITNWVLDTNIEILEDDHDLVSEEPEIDVSPDNAVVIITGVAQETSSCASVAATPSYDSATGILSVDIFNESSGNPPCLTEVYAQPYRLVVTFDEGIPQKIQIEEGSSVELEESY